MVIFVLQIKTQKMKKIIFSLLLSTIILLLPAASSAQSGRYIDALKHYQNGNIDEARTLFEEEIKANPENDAAYYYLANIAISEISDPQDQSAVAKAEALMKRALELDPENFWYKNYLALFYASTDRVELTTRLLEELIEKYPKKSYLYFDAANAYLTLKDVDKALETIDKIEKLTGKSEMICMTKLDLLRRKGNSEEDSFKFLEDYYKDCRTPHLATVLGDYNLKMYRDSAAIAYYTDAISMDSSYSPAYYGRAHVYQAIRKYDNYFSDISHFLKDANILPSAKADYLQGLMESPQFVVAFPQEVDRMMLETREAHPADSLINTVLGVFYYRTERPYLAIEVLRQNFEQYPESYNAAMQYLMVLYYSQVWDKVIETSTVLLQKYPKQTDILQLRGIAFWQEENFSSAMEDYRQIAASAPKDSATIVLAHTALGDLCHQAGDAKQAYKHYDKVLKVSPDNVPVLNNYAYYLSMEGKNLKKARQMSQKTIQAEPDNPTYLDTYAWILHLEGMDLEAKAHFKHAMLYGGKEHAVILDHYAEVLYSLKEYDLAYIYWDQAKALDPNMGIDEKVKQKKAAQGR